MMTPTQLYKESHVGNLIGLKSKGDEKVQIVLDNQTDREKGNPKNNPSTFQECNTIINVTAEENGIPLTMVGENDSQTLERIAPNSYESHLKMLKTSSMNKL